MIFDLSWLAGAAVAGALVAGSAAWTARGWLADSEMAERDRQAAAALRAETDRQAEIERVGRMARDRSLDHAHAQITAAHRAARGADATAGLLRQHVVALAADRAAGADPAPLGSGVAAGPAILVHTDVLDWLESAGREAAAALDLARIAGLACQAEYAAVRDARLGAGKMKP